MLEVAKEVLNGEGSVALEATPSMLLPAPDSPWSLVGNAHELETGTTETPFNGVANGGHHDSPHDEQPAADQAQQTDGTRALSQLSPTANQVDTRAGTILPNGCGLAFGQRLPFIDYRVLTCSRADKTLSIICATFLMSSKVGRLAGFRRQRCGCRAGGSSAERRDPLSESLRSLASAISDASDGALLPSELADSFSERWREEAQRVRSSSLSEQEQVSAPLQCQGPCCRRICPCSLRC